MEQSEGKKSDNSQIANKKTPLQKVGDFLREARQGRNLSTEELSSSLRIGKEQLIALEDGDEAALPEKVFIRAMVRRIAEKLNIDTSFILEELNERKKNEPKLTPLIKTKNIEKNKKEAKYNTLIKKETTKKNKSINPFIIVLVSGALGLLTSFMVLKYIERAQKESINLQKSEIFLYNKN